MNRQECLLIDGLDFNEPHRGTADGFADGLRIDRVRLSSLEIWFHVERWHQPDIMTELADLSTPMVS